MHARVRTHVHACSVLPLFFDRYVHASLILSIDSFSAWISISCMCAVPRFENFRLRTQLGHTLPVCFACVPACMRVLVSGRVGACACGSAYERVGGCMCVHVCVRTCLRVCLRVCTRGKCVSNFPSKFELVRCWVPLLAPAEVAALQIVFSGLQRC